MIHISLTKNLIPPSGTPGDFWIPRDCRRIFIVGSNSKIVDLTDALDGDCIRGASIALLEEVDALKAQIDELLAANVKGQEYISWLRERREKAEREQNDCQ